MRLFYLRLFCFVFRVLFLFFHIPISEDVIEFQKLAEPVFVGIPDIMVTAGRMINMVTGPSAFSHSSKFGIWMFFDEFSERSQIIGQPLKIFIFITAADVIFRKKKLR